MYVILIFSSVAELATLREERRQNVRRESLVSAAILGNKA